MFGGYTVVPDPNGPNMYRVCCPDGSLTDMVNLTRAKDAASVLNETAGRARRTVRGELSVVGRHPAVART